MAQFASESFTGTEGTELSAHNASFTKCPSLTGAIEIASNRGRCTSTTSPGYYHSGAPAGADYQVTADLTKVSAAVSFLGLLGRQSTSANTCYRATVDPTTSGTTGTMQLFKFVAGVATQLGSSTSVAYVTSAAATQIKLEMVGSAIKVFWDGSGSPTISVTDTAISAAGKAGVRGFSSAAPGDSVGGHITNFSADDIVSGVTITGTPGNAVAAGTSATVNQARSVTGTTGNAAAAGVTATVNQARTVTGAVGNAVAAGISARINQARAITGTTGNAVAAGVHATITAAGAVVITGTPGNAAAAGVSASINQARSVTGTAGNADAAGVQATISTSSGVTITATPGNAFASGPQAIIVRHVAISAAVGNAVAAGRQATVSNITATDDLYPLEGMSQDYPLQGMTQTYPLAGQTPS